MIVVVKETGYIYNKRVREGQKLKLKDPKHFSAKWMMKIEDVPVVDDMDEVLDVKPNRKGKMKKTPANVFGSLVKADEEDEEVI